MGALGLKAYLLLAHPEVDDLMVEQAHAAGAVLPGHGRWTRPAGVEFYS